MHQLRFFIQINLLAFLLTISSGYAAEDKFLGSLWQNWWNVNDADPYLGSLFNQVTPENAGKWGPVQRDDPDQWRWGPLDAMVSYAETHNMVVKQHAFIWGHPHSVPDWVTNDNAAEAADRWMETFANRYSGIQLIDVVNEAPHAAPSYKDALGGDGESGWDWVIWSYQRARLYAPTAKLILNDYDVLKRDGVMNTMIEIAHILQSDQLIDGIGCQAHFLEGTSASAVRQRLDTLYAETGLPIYISEFDLDISNHTNHRNRFSELFTVFWEHPAVRGVTLWGHVEGTMWREHGWLVSADGEERLAMQWLKGYLAQMPGQASNPLPHDGATQLDSHDILLQWHNGSAATRRKVYLGTSSELTENDLLAHQYDLNYRPTNLTPGETYYWRVDEHNANGITTGQVWSFTTAPGVRSVTLTFEPHLPNSELILSPDHGHITLQDQQWTINNLWHSQSYFIQLIEQPMEVGFNPVSPIFPSQHGVHPLRITKP